MKEKEVTQTIWLGVIWTHFVQTNYSYFLNFFSGIPIYLFLYLYFIYKKVKLQTANLSLN